MLQPLRARDRAILTLKAHWPDVAVCDAAAPHTLCSSSIDAVRCSFDADVKYRTLALRAGVCKVENSLLTAAMPTCTAVIAACNDRGSECVSAKSLHLTHGFYACSVVFVYGCACTVSFMGSCQPKLGRNGLMMCHIIY